MFDRAKESIEQFSLRSSAWKFITIAQDAEIQDTLPQPYYQFNRAALEMIMSSLVSSQSSNINLVVQQKLAYKDVEIITHTIHHFIKSFIVANINFLNPSTPLSSNHRNMKTRYSFQLTTTPPSVPSTTRLCCVTGPA